MKLQPVVPLNYNNKYGGSAFSMYSDNVNDIDAMSTETFGSTGILPPTLPIASERFARKRKSTVKVERPGKRTNRGAAIMKKWMNKIKTN